MGKVFKYKVKKRINDAEIDIDLEDVLYSLRNAVVDEYNAIRTYVNIYEEIKSISERSGKDYSDVLKCIQDIIDEEKKHVGEFNEMIKTVSQEEYELYEEGKKEVIKIIRGNK